MCNGVFYVLSHLTWSINPTKWIVQWICKDWNPEQKERKLFDFQWNSKQFCLINVSGQVCCVVHKQFDILVKCGETVRFAIYCIVYQQRNILRKCGETVRFAMMYVYLQTNFFLVLFYTNLSYLAVSNFSSLWELTEGGSPPSFSRAICSTWQGLSALLHTRIWQSSG